jgi:Na+-translocating ferredoxin:NAD+ oxidoreductase RnfG subunit
MKKLIIILLVFNSCSINKVANINKPTKKDIKKAMKYAKWEYKMPNTINQ